jgi:hypothetical protein
MKKLVIAVAVAVLTGATVSMAVSGTEKTVLSSTPLEFKGKVKGLDGKSETVDTSKVSTNGQLFLASLREVTFDNVGETNVTAVSTNEYFVLASVLSTTNLVSIGGGTNLVTVVNEVTQVLDVDAAVVDSKGKFTADFYGDAPTTNITRDVMVTGTIKQDKKNPTTPKINGKVTGVWLDKISTVTGNIKNAKTK